MRARRGGASGRGPTRYRPHPRYPTRVLFRGALGVFKNPSSHREVEFDGPTEAAEVVMLADLLLRMLDRIAQRR